MLQKKTGFSLKKLSIQFSLIAIGIPTLVLMGVGLVQVKALNVKLASSLNTKLKNEAAQLSASLSTALFNFDDETCQVIVAAAMKKPEITGIAIRDLNEVYLSSGGDEETGDDEEKGASKIVREPIIFKSETIGTLELTATTRLMKIQLAELKKSILLQILVVDMVLAFVLTLVLLLRFVRPLKALEKGSEHIAAGNLDYPIDVGRKDEIGSLAANLLIMRDAVREKVASLEGEIRRHEKTTVTLQTTKEYIDSIINSMPSMLISLDSDMNITQWNDRARELTGITSEEAVGRLLFDVAGEFTAIRDDIRNTMESGEIFVKARQPRSRGESSEYEDIAVYPLISEHAKGAVIRVDDVTENVRMEQMVVQSEKMMSVGGLAAGMAHEINNPLAGMMQNAQVVLRRINEDMPASIDAAKEAGTTIEAIRDFMKKRGINRQLESIHHAGVRASQIVHNMLSFARKDNTGKAGQNLAEILDLTLELAQSDYDLKKQYDFKTIEIQREYAPDLPLVSCEASKIQQVFFNILKNCAEAIQDVKDRKGESPKFILRVFKKGHDVVVEIEDNGPGMDELVRKRVFEPFFTTKPVGQGTGLGLSVSYFIITESHGGKMSVVSSPGKGARFIIQLPVA
ncbi:MAG: HAMP domain-containing protein [Desulfobacter sp.]|nr:MAG: HAMP domain-containing protein [Desulfobacter sp.]